MLGTARVRDPDPPSRVVRFRPVGLNVPAEGEERSGRTVLLQQSNAALRRIALRDAAEVNFRVAVQRNALVGKINTVRTDRFQRLVGTRCVCPVKPQSRTSG